MKLNIGSVSLTLFCSLFAVAVNAEPVNLRCEFLRDPQCVDIAGPRLSWEMQDQARDAKQSAFEIRVADTGDALSKDAADVWSSGKISGDQSINVKYGGRALKSGERVFWKVRTWDALGKSSDWSQPATWTMGLLNSTDWKAKWIGKDEPLAEATLRDTNWIWFPEGSPEVSAPVATRWFRRVVEIPDNRSVQSAKLQITADDNYHVFINGNEISTGENHLFAATVDATAAVKSGKNALCVKATNGGEAPNSAGLILKLVIDFQSGPPMQVISDNGWKTSDKGPADWLKSDFDDGEWKSAKVLGPAGMMPWGDVQLRLNRELPARWLRKQFSLEKPLKRATAFYSGLGLSELYINGRVIGTEKLSPSLSEYNKRVFYVSHDVTDSLKSGGNVVGVVLGNGRFFAPRLTVPTPTRTFGYPKLLLQIRLVFQDGSERDVISDESWKLTTHGPIRTNNEYDGETYDARCELPNWSSEGGDETGWEPATVVSGPGGALSSAMQEPIEITGQIKPVSITQPAPNVYIFDMGQNMVGWCKLRVAAAAGTRIAMRFAETLKPDGNLYLANLRSALVTDTYISKGGSAEVWQPRFTYHGFRYVELTGFPGVPTLDTLQGQVVNDALASTGGFETSNTTINQVYHNMLWGIRGNYRSIPTDCPQRDERQGWLGDRAGECRGETYLFDNGPLYAKWVRDINDCQRENGALPDVCPGYWVTYNDDVTWPSSFITIPGTLLDQFGDHEALARNYPAMSKWIDHMAGFLVDDTIYRDSYGDWCNPPADPKEIHSSDPAKRTASYVMGTTSFYNCCRLMERYANVLGRSEDAKKFAALAVRLQLAFDKHLLVRTEGRYDNGTQTSSVLTLAFGMVPVDMRDKVFARLVNQITHESNNHIATGLVGGQWLNRVLSDNGRPDLAYTIATNKTYPSLGYMADHGATTIWELWNGDTADPAMNSGNHVMLIGDLTLWFYEYLAGIRPDPENPGFKHILMKPTVVGDLTFVKGSHHSPYGMILSEWHRTGNAFTWDITIPGNTTATVTVPGTAVTEGNVQTSATVKLGAGQYHFKSTLE